MTDGTKSFSIDALTCAGTATLNGNVTLGNASGDDVTFTGSLASTIPIKTNNSYNIGSATLGLAGVYLGAPSDRSTRVTAHQSLGASNTIVLPNGDGTAGHFLVGDGAGNLSYRQPNGRKTTKTADYTITDADMSGLILVTTSTTDRTVTLPTAADNENRIITVKKVDSAIADLIVDGEGAETIDGATTYTMSLQYEMVTVWCDGTGWHIVDRYVPLVLAAYATSASGQTFSATLRVDYETQITDTHSAVTTGASWKFTVPKTGNYSISARIATAVMSWTAGFAASLDIYKTVSTKQRRIGYGEPEATINQPMTMGGSAVVSLTKGDEIFIQANQDGVASPGDLNQSQADNYVSIRGLF